MSRTHSHADQLIPPHLIGLTRVTHEQFEEFCRDYPDLRLELTSSGELIVMPPTGSQTGRRNSKLNSQLDNWATKNGTGVTFSALAGFTLPNGAIRSPDASWLRRERWDVLTDQQKESFAPICPDFVIELRSRSDNRMVLHRKMQEYLANGASLGWLIDPYDRRFYIYRTGEEVTVLKNPAVVSGEPLLPEFELRLEEIW